MTRMKVLLAVAAAAIGTAVVYPARGVGTSNWAHTTEADFKNGTFDNVVATNLGDLKLSRAVKTLLEQDPQVSTVNALAEGPDGTIYAGTGPKGILLRVKGQAVEKIASLDDATNIFSLTFDKDGRLLVGTGGENGKIFRLDDPAKAKAIDAEGKGGELKEIFHADGVQYIWAIRQTPDGNVYAATGPTGQLWEIKPDNTTRVVLDSDENNLTALLSDGKDMLYVGTDPNGLIYRVNRKTGESFVMFDAPEAEISALVMDRQGNIYASTAEARDESPAPAPQAAPEAAGRPEGGATGVPIPSEPPKEPQPPKLPDPNPGRPNPIPKQPAGKAEKTNAELGMLNAELDRRFGRPASGVRRHSTLAVIVPDVTAEAGEPGPGGPEPHPKPPKNPAPVPAPKPAKPTTVPSGMPAPGRQPTVEQQPAEPKPEGNAVYKIDRDGFVTEVFRQPVLILSMVEHEGQLLLATGSEGQVYQVNPAAEETVVVAKVEPRQIMTLLAGKDGQLYLGTANTGSIAAMSSGFAAKGSYTSAVLDATQISRFGKVHLHGTLPKGDTLTVATRSGNVQDAGEKGWSNWSEETPATEFLPVTSPPARFLQYRFTFTSPDGKTTPIVEDVNIAYQIPNLPPAVRAVKIEPVQDPAAAAAAAASGAAPPPSRRLAIGWEAADPNNDALQFSVYFRQAEKGGNAPWILLKDKITEAGYEWDTRTVADGRYEVKVVASDEAANEPGKGRTGSRVSDPIEVDNTPPVVGDLKAEQKGANVKVSFRVVDRTSTVAGAEYSVDSSRDWQAILPSDSIWDSPEETAAFSLTGLQPGAHQVTIRATDAKGNQAFETVFVTVQGPAAAK